MVIGSVFCGFFIISYYKPEMSGMEMVKETGVDKFANDIVCLISSGLVEDPVMGDGKVIYLLKINNECEARAQ